ncbi:MAG: TlpA disulfide reductase family protein [Chitinophagaceae bacterium]
MIKPNVIITFFVFLLFIDTAIAQPRQGQMAADIALPSANGDTLRLSSLKGKVVLLDFWASWCGPCRVANKGLAKMYDKFKKKGFEIFSVSLDDEREDWIKAIKKDKITWIQVIEPGAQNAPTASRWGIYALPTTYLIDREGRLVAMDLEGKDLEKALKEMLGD